jgi:hypothetical protein
VSRRKDIHYAIVNDVDPCTYNADEFELIGESTREEGREQRIVIGDAATAVRIAMYLLNYAEQGK